MNKISGIIVIFLFLAWCRACGGAEPATQAAAATRKPDGIIDEIKARGKLIVAQVGVDQPPFFWRKSTGSGEEWVGYEIDFAKEIADKLGVELEILRLGDDYNETCRAVHAGLADIGVSNLSDTEARREIVDFTKPYIVSRVAMIVDLVGLEKDGIDAIEPKDLNRPAVKALLTRDSAYAFVADELMPLAERVTVPQGDFDQITKPLMEGKAHFIVDDGLTLNLGMTQHPEYSPRFYLHVFPEYDDPLSVCIPQNQPKLKEFINAIIDEIEEKEPVTLEFLVDKYMK